MTAKKWLNGFRARHWGDPFDHSAFARPAWSRQVGLDSITEGVTLIEAFQSLYPDAFRIGLQDDNSHRLFFDLLAGGTGLREAIQSGQTSQYFLTEAGILEHFSEDITPYLLYR